MLWCKLKNVLTLWDGYLEVFKDTNTSSTWKDHPTLREVWISQATLDSFLRQGISQKLSHETKQKLKIMLQINLEERDVRLFMIMLASASWNNQVESLTINFSKKNAGCLSLARICPNMKNVVIIAADVETNYPRHVFVSSILGIWCFHIGRVGFLMGSWFWSWILRHLILHRCVFSI